MQVMNLTDVDDRIIQNAAAAGVSIREYTEKYVQAFSKTWTRCTWKCPKRSFARRITSKTWSR